MNIVGYSMKDDGMCNSQNHKMLYHLEHIR